MSETPDLRYEERRPGERWRPFVECFWLAVDPRPRRSRAPEHIVPDGCPELIVHLGDPFRRRVDGRWRRQPRAFLAGTLSRPWSVRGGRVIDTFGIRFRPAGLPGLVAIDLSSAVDRELTLAALVGRSAARELSSRLVAAGSGLAPRARAAEVWLAALPPAARRSATELAPAAVERIRRARGGMRVEAIARELGVSRRRLERAFARDLGIGPKLFARIVRLQAALLELAADQRAAGVDVALTAGYFDQSHLLRDFRGVAGRRPTRDRAADGELARHFTAPERLLALLAGE